MHKYEFCEENTECFLNFLRVVKASKYCNLMEHEKFEKNIPRNGHFQYNCNNIIKKCETIDLTESDEEVTLNISNGSHIPQDLETHAPPSLNYSTICDALHSIKESLQTKNNLSISAIQDLDDLKSDQYEIFHSLSEDLNLEEVLNFGLCLKTANIRNSIVLCYIRFLLLKQLWLEYSDQLQDLLNDYSIRFSETLIEELTKVLLNKNVYCKIFLQFIDGLHMDFKQKLLRKFIMVCEKLQENHIPVLEVLITADLEVETVTKMLENLSKGDNFSTNKSFGKLLITIMKILGRNLILLEQPLKHVIGTHKSIWKSKLQKSFDDCLRQNSMLSQSFRC